MKCRDDPLHRDADFAIRLEPADSRTMPGARIITMNGRQSRSFRRPWAEYAHGTRYRLIQLAAVDDKFSGILQDMRRRLRDVFPILIAAPTLTSINRTLRWPIHHVLKPEATSPDISHRQRCIVHRHFDLVV
jgi:hypothetical protein